MEIKRFYVEKNQIKDGVVELSGEEHYHLSKVLRFKQGYKLIVCDNSGLDYHCTVDKITSTSTFCTVDEIKINETELKIDLILLFGVIKPEKFEIGIQKAVELGVNKIIPFFSENSDSRNVRLDRLNRIALEACKQCGRAKLPLINEPMSFEEALQKATGKKIIAYEKEKENTLKLILSDVGNYESSTLVIGSEGGFTPEEVAYAKEKGFVSVTLGKRILRAETAVIAGLANLAMFLED